MIEKLKNILSQSEFSKNVLTLMTGTGIAQVLPVLASLVLARLYSPEDFGVFALFTSIYTILGTVSCFRYEVAIVLPKEDNKSKALVIISIIILISVFLFLLTGYFLFSESILLRVSEYAKEPNRWFFLIFPAIFLYSLYQILNFWLNRNKKYKAMAYSRMIQSGVIAVFSILFGLLQFSFLGLIAGSIIGLLTSSSYLLYQTIKQQDSFSKSFNKVYLKSVAFEYIDFPKYATLSTLFNSFATIGLPILITFFFGVEISGLYFFAMKLVRLPLNIMFSSFSQVYREKAAYLFSTDKKQLLVFTKSLQKKIILLMVPSLLIASILAPYVFSFIFGSEWYQAGIYVRYFSIFILLSSIYSPISSIGDVLMEQKAVLVFNFILSTSQFLILYFSSKLFSFEISILILSVICGSFYLFLDYYMKQVLINKIPLR